MNTYLYIKIEQKIMINNKKVLVKDVATLHSNNSSYEKELGNAPLMTVDVDFEHTYTFSIMRIVELATKICPDVEIINLGETDFIIEYQPPKDKSLLFEYTKTVLVALTLFFGAGFTIMSFNQDISVANLFSKIYMLATGANTSRYQYLEISYSIGIGLGIIVLFNHFKKSKIHDDPTPIQIEMRKYEESINETIIANAEREGKVKDMR